MGQKSSTNPKTKKSTIRLSFYALGLLLFLIILGKLISFVYSLNQPITPNLTPKREYSLNSKSTLNFLFINSSEKNNLSLVSFYPTDQKAIVLHISDQIYLEVPKEYGMWQVSSIYSLGQEEKPSIGAQLLSLSISKLVGLPIDGVVFLEDNQTTIEEFIANLRKNPLAPLFSVKTVRSNLTPLEQYNLFKQLSSIRSDKISSLDLAQSSITESKLLADSSRVLGVDTYKLDSFIRDKMADPNILDEGYSIAIFNGTSRSGLAQEASRIVTNMGGNVVITATSLIKVNQSQVIIKGDVEKNKNSVTALRIAETFAPRCLKTRCQTEDSEVNNSRAQINIIIGEDFFNFWHKR